MQISVVGENMASSVDLPVVTPPMMEKQTIVFYILSVQETNTRDNSRVQTMTLVDMDVERRSILYFFSVHLPEIYIHRKEGTELYWSSKLSNQ